MTTKDHCLSDRGDGICGKPSSNQYNNLNLNYNYRNLHADNKRSKKIFTNNNKNDNYDFTHSNDLHAKRDSYSWKKSNKNLPSNLCNFDCGSQENDEFKKSKGTNRSTLSLHIAAYENSVEETVDSKCRKKEGSNGKHKKTSLIQKWEALKQGIVGSSSFFQNPFEFPRQQEDQHNHLEVMHFKASQQLLNPNKEKFNVKERNNTVSSVVVQPNHPQTVVTQDILHEKQSGHREIGDNQNRTFPFSLWNALTTTGNFRMNRFLLYGTICVLLLLLVVFAAEDESLPDIPVGEVAIDDKGNLVPKSSSELVPGSTLNLGFYHAFVAALSVIIVSELGDKTWFIAAIMAMRHSRIAVFAGAMAALALMTVLSACLGWVTQIIPRKITFYISTALFALFGLKMLHEGYHMSGDEGAEEYEEANAEVQKTTLELDNGQFSDMEGGVAQEKNKTWDIFRFVSNIFTKSFMLTFVAEWGDRSQLTTIILAARENVTGVILGGVLGHMICTGIAVVFGRLLAQRISVRTVTIIGGVVFILFALSALFIEAEP